MFRSFRKLVFKILLLQPINTFGRLILKALPASLTSQGRYVFPVKGQLQISYQPYGRFKMESNGLDSIASRTYFSNAFANDPPTAKSLTALFMSSRCFYDIGANTGLYSLMAGVHPHIQQVHAFEPAPSVFQFLERNFKINSAQKLKPHLLAISDQSRNIKFRIPNGIMLPVGSSTAGSEKPFNDSTFTDLEVQAIALDDFLADGTHMIPDVIKIDTETTEPQVLQGARKTIEKHRPAIVAEVITEQVAKALHDFFKPLGYRFQHLSESPQETTSIKPDLSAMNYAFVPEEKYDQYLENLAKI